MYTAKRAELHLHTTTSLDGSVITPKELIETAVLMGLKAVALTDLDSVQNYIEAANCREKYGEDLKVIYGAELSSKGRRTFLAKDKRGLKAIYKLVSGKEISPSEREHILIGSGNMAEALFAADSYEAEPDFFKDVDYIELFISDDEKLKDQNKELYHLGKKLRIPVVAVGNCHYISPEDAICKAVLSFKEEETLSHLRSTEEMLEAFSYLGEDAAFEVVSENPEALCDSIEYINPADLQIPKLSLPDAFRKLSELCTQKLFALYGEEAPQEIHERMQEELRLIHICGSDSLFLLSHKVSEHIRGLGAMSGTRGTTGSALCAYLLGFSDINPLPPHYYCPDCHHFEFSESGDGFDLPLKMCPHCNRPLIGDGHDIPFETFLHSGKKRTPEVSINVSEASKSMALDFLGEFLGEDRICAAGIVSVHTQKSAEEKISLYENHIKKKFHKAEFQRIAEKIKHTKRDDSVHPAGILLLPSDSEWEDITPTRAIRHSVNNLGKATHFDYFTTENSLTKINISVSPAYDKLQKLIDITGVSLEDIKFGDPVVYKLFESLDFEGIPEFCHPIYEDILSRVSQVDFTTLVKLMGFTHSTNAWLKNGERLLGKYPLSQLISTRDDVYLLLRSYGVEKKSALIITEKVRRGRFCTEDKENEILIEEMLHYGVPYPYIESMSRMVYLFPKAHALHYAMLAYYCAWFKVYHREAFLDVFTKEF